MDLKSRMEARRKRILENSEARMSKILGRPYISKETTTDRSLDGLANTVYSISNGISNGSTTSSTESSNSRTADIQRLLGNFNNEPDEEETTAAASVPLPPPSDYVNSLIFIALGLLARLTYLLGISWIFCQNLMMPFFLVGIPWTYLQSKDHAQIPGMIPAILIYCGLQQTIVKKLVRIYTFFRMLSQYFSLYLFFFIILHFILDSTINI